MKEGKASRTAAATSFARAFESIRSKDKRVCYDPYAKDFLGGIYSILTHSLFPTRMIMRMLDWYGERVNPGGFALVAVRTKYIDDYLMECIDDGIEQVVMLGAGYDARAYRIDELKRKVKVFEVDHPDTQSVKIEKVKKIFGTLPEHVIYVPVDFNIQKLDERLFESGYDKNLKTLFIWEGVTLYLTAEAVDETLGLVANKSGKGSSIIFDYYFKSVVDGTCKEAEKMRRCVERRGDPYTFGIEEGTIEEFLDKRGYDQVKEMTAKSLEDTYINSRNLSRKVSPFFSVVHATVKPRE